MPVSLLPVKNLVTGVNIARLTSGWAICEVLCSGSKVMPFFEVNSLFGSLNVKDEYQSYSSSNKTGMSSIGAGAGIAVKLGDKVTFDMMAVTIQCLKSPSKIILMMKELYKNDRL